MIKIMISIILGILLLVSPVMAQEEVDPGITPDQGILWGIDIALEKIGMLLTLKPENKVNLGLKRANERLAEMQVMMEQNKIQFMNRAEMERSEIIDEVEEDAEGLNEEHREQIRERLQKHIQVLERVRERAPEQAQIGLETAINKSSQVLERIRK